MEILYSDIKIVVCIKPVGLDSETDVPAALKEALGGAIFPIHRLDQNVGGVMVFSKNKKSAACISKQIQENTFKKTYLAIVDGAIEEGAGT